MSLNDPEQEEYLTRFLNGVISEFAMLRKSENGLTTIFVAYHEGVLGKLAD
ncbi:hypothetical protein NA78x_005499 [Anatilimnocola sp. NA78]|uniref:hypothetical protein n=1 Tax=Anatilimnocola sp. NA78 TaxID=3415683 RepID=UPI003CE4E7BF